MILKSTNQIESFMDVPEMLVWTSLLAFFMVSRGRLLQTNGALEGGWLEKSIAPAEHQVIDL